MYFIFLSILFPPYVFCGAVVVTFKIRFLSSPSFPLALGEIEIVGCISVMRMMAFSSFDNSMQYLFTFLDYPMCIA